MNKAELIDAVAEAADLKKSEAARALDSAIDNITNALKGGDSVTLVGFGTFTVRKREARMGRNPRTGEAIQIKASRVPGFKAGKALKDALN
ncbi:MAG: HU family DNA-binding protein [Gammaproteobacteria bacterium]|tara:strand:+ start:245 stop:517 length:273 start_codon:yes stop_codon:yes gene_type:complete